MPDRQQPETEPAHDILAAEAFEVPAADPGLHHGPIKLPDDPTGEAAPHDVLAAEEFAMPAPSPHPAVALTQRRGGVGRLVAEVAVLGLLLALILRRRRTG